MLKAMNFGRSFLLWYAHDLMNFRLQELEAITSCYNIKFEWLEDPSVNDPFLLINCKSSSDVMKIMSRTVLIKSAYELWAKSKTLADLHMQLKKLPTPYTEPYCGIDVSFRIMVESFGKKISKDYKVQRIDELEFLSFEGPIKLKDPDHSFLLMEYYGTDRNNAPELPYRLFFGR